MIHQMTVLSKEQLDELLTRPETVDDFIERVNERLEEFSLYKSWQVMHFLINGDAWRGRVPLGWAVFADKELGTVDVGYGPARYLLPAQVQRLAQALRKLSADRLFEGFDAAAMRGAELYGAPQEGDEEWEKAELRKYYAELVAFYEGAAKAGFGVLTWLH